MYTGDIRSSRDPGTNNINIVPWATQYSTPREIKKPPLKPASNWPFHSFFFKFWWRQVSKYHWQCWEEQLLIVNFNTKLKSDTNIHSKQRYVYWSYVILQIFVHCIKTNIKTSVKFINFGELGYTFVQQITFEPNHFLRSSFLPCWGIFANWSQTKVELNQGKVLCPSIL